MELAHAVRAIARGMPHLLTGGVPPVRAGDQRLAFRRLGLQPSGRLTLASTVFREGERIPHPYSVEGGNHEPPVRWAGVPPQARSLSLIVEDPDAPTPNPFVHWIVHRVAPGASSPALALASGAVPGRNSLLRTGWTGCAPPRGDQPHRYVFQLFALDAMPPEGPAPGRSALLQALRGHVIDVATLVGTWSR